MGGGPSSTQTTQYPAWAAPTAAGYLGLTANQVNADLARGYNPAFNQQIAGFTPYQAAGFEQGAVLAQDPDTQAAMAEALRNVSQTQAGEFLNPATNPYLTATFNAAAQPVTQQFRDTTAPGINGMFAQAGSFGGSANQQIMSDAQQNLGNTLANLATGIFGGNYEQERQNQLAQQQGLGNIMTGIFAPSSELLSLGGQQQQQAQNILDAARQNALQQYKYPYSTLQNLGTAIQQAVGGSGVQKITGSGKGLL